MRYRADIDGLRAISIIPVVLFHAGVMALSGGYVGVDVFFVISGYLITGILLDDLQKDERHPIFSFYERRIRRIFPALAVVLTIVPFVAAVAFLPHDFAAVPPSVIAALLSVSNIFFYRETGYFDAPAQTKPLLHTWSLSVEEQFYFLFPILMAIVVRRRSAMVPAILLAFFFVSFIGCIAFTPRRPSFAFYWLPTRAWELLGGSLIAVLHRRWSPARREAREVVAGVGLVAICLPILTYDESTPFPGIAAAPPVLGAMAVLACAQGTMVGRLLSLKPLVAIGLISYSLYLWHWPSIVFTTYVLDAPLGGWRTTLVVAFSLLAAALSFRFVERPFRNRQRYGRRKVFAVSTAAAVCIAAGALGGQALQGWPSRFAPEVVRIADMRLSVSPWRAECHQDEVRRLSPGRACILGANVRPHFAVWGDSHAVEISAALSELLAERGQSLHQFSYSSCPPALDFEVSLRPGCRAFNYEVLSFLTSSLEIEVVFLVSFMDGKLRDDARFVPSLGETVNRLERNGKRVVLMYPVPTQPRPVPQSLAKYEASGWDMRLFGTTRVAFFTRNAQLLAGLDGLGGPGTLRARPADFLCAQEVCMTYMDGKVLYFDHHHLSMPGARLIAPLLMAGIRFDEMRPLQ